MGWGICSLKRQSTLRRLQRLLSSFPPGMAMVVPRYEFHVKSTATKTISSLPIATQILHRKEIRGEICALTQSAKCSNVEP